MREHDLYLSKIEESINKLIDRFLEYPHYFRAESDLQSYLYHLLVTQDILKKEHVTQTGIPIGIVHTEYPATVGWFDLVVLDPTLVSELALQNQKILCAIEIGLDTTYAHFEKDYSEKFTIEAQNDVSFGYILHFVKGESVHWKNIVDAVDQVIEMKESSLLRKEETPKAKAIAVKSDLMRARNKALF